MKKFLLLVFAALSITSCASKSSVKNLNNNNSTESNNPITPEQNDDKYTIRFLNDEGTEISSKQYEFGEMPEAPDTPSKENPLPQYTYTFSGWSPSIALVTEDVDYVATYKVDAKIGEVKWVDGDGKTLLTDTYAYGSMPYYHGNIPTKTPTDTESYVFKGWSPEVSLVSKESTTYVAQFSPIYAKYSIQINCTDCLVNKKKHIDEEHNVLSDLTYQFNNTSKETYHYPYKLEVMVDGKVTNDYAYDNITGKLNIKLTGNTVINAIADNSCVLMKYKYSTSYPTVEIKCDGEFESVDWGDGTTYDATNKSHTYSDDPDVDQYDIRIFGKLSSIGTTSKAVTKVGIFYSVTSIGDEAFRNCSSLTSITIPNSVTSIGDEAFYNCSSLTSITIPNSVTSIGDETFYNCSSLASIIIPNSVAYIGWWAIRSCSSLTIYCEVESEPSEWSTWNANNRPVYWGYLSTGSTSDFNYVVQKFNGIKQLSISKFIGDEITVNVPGEINVDGENIPVTTIGDEAFRNCSSLTSITIPNSVTTIGRYAFYHCSSLTSIVIPDSVTSIGDEAFRNCSSLTSITIPNSVTTIGRRAFDDCSSIVIYCKAESKPAGWDETWNYSNRPVYWDCLSIGSTSDFNYVVQKFNGIKQLSISKFIGDEITVNIPGEINVDGENIPVTSIGDEAFDDCSSLTSITIPNSVTTIGRYAFYHCSSLTSIVIPDSVTSIGNSAFGNCSSIVIYCKVESKPSGWSDTWNSYGRPVYWGYLSTGSTSDFNYVVQQINSTKQIAILKYIGNDTIVNIPGEINVDGENIPVTSIGDEAFDDCSSLTSITIPNSVTSIGDKAFYDCSSLTSIVIPNSVTSIGAYASHGCYNLTIYCETESKPSGWSDTWNSYDRPVYWGCLSIGSTSDFNYVVQQINGTKQIAILKYIGNDTIVNIPSEINVDGENIPVTSIGYRAFRYRSLTSIVIPNSVTSISDEAFFNCSLTSIVIPNSVTSIGDKAFNACYALTSITIPNSVTSIGDDAFSGCSSLTSIVVDNENTKYDSRDNCNAIIETSSNVLITGCKNTIIPNSVTSIGSYAFEKCSFTSIAIPNSVTSIGSWAFRHCSSLELLDLSSCDHVVFAGYEFLSETGEALQIKVKASLVEDYKSATHWSDYADKIIGVE